MKIKYKFANNETKEVEVDEQTYKNIKDIERETHTINKRLFRHESSLEFEPADEINIEEQLFKEKQIEQLNYALTFLSPQQKDLVNEVFFNDRQLKDIANEQNISYQAIQNRLAKILEKLRKNF